MGLKNMSIYLGVTQPNHNTELCCLNCCACQPHLVFILNTPYLSSCLQVMKFPVFVSHIHVIAWQQCDIILGYPKIHQHGWHSGHLKYTDVCILCHLMWIDQSWCPFDYATLKYLNGRMCSNITWPNGNQFASDHWS